MNNETTPTQKTAMMQLRDRLQAKADNDNHPIAQIAYSDAISIIDTELLEIEKQNLINFGDSCIRNVEYGFETEKHFNQTFNPK